MILGGDYTSAGPIYPLILPWSILGGIFAEHMEDLTECWIGIHPDRSPKFDSISSEYSREVQELLFFGDLFLENLYVVQ